GNYDISASGSANFTFQQTFAELNSSRTLSADGSLNFSFSASGTELPSNFTLATYNLSETGSDNFTRQVINDDINQRYTRTENGNESFQVIKNGDGTAGDYQLSRTGSSSSSWQEKGVDASGRARLFDDLAPRDQTGDQLVGAFTQSATSTDNYDTEETGNY